MVVLLSLQTVRNAIPERQEHSPFFAYSVSGSATQDERQFHCKTLSRGAGNSSPSSPSPNVNISSFPRGKERRNASTLKGQMPAAHFPATKCPTTALHSPEISPKNSLSTEGSRKKIRNKLHTKKQATKDTVSTTYLLKHLKSSNQMFTRKILEVGEGEVFTTLAIFT